MVHRDARFTSLSASTAGTILTDGQAGNSCLTDTEGSPMSGNSRFSMNGTPKDHGDDLLDRQRKATERMSPMFDQLNATFAEVEKALKAFQPIRDVGVEYCCDPNQWYSDYVGLAKYKNEWRLCVWSENAANPEE